MSPDLSYRGISFSSSFDRSLILIELFDLIPMLSSGDGDSDGILSIRSWGLIGCCRGCCWLRFGSGSWSIVSTVDPTFIIYVLNEVSSVSNFMDNSPTSLRTSRSWSARSSTSSSARSSASSPPSFHSLLSSLLSSSPYSSWWWSALVLIVPFLFVFVVCLAYVTFLKLPLSSWSSPWWFKLYDDYAIYTACVCRSRLLTS